MRAKTTQRLTLAALMGALCAVLSQIQIPLPPVPLSLSLVAVYLAGALLGSAWGAAAIGGYVLLGAIGVPVFAGFSGGISVLFGPTGGYIFGYVLCAALTGRIVRSLGFSRRALWFSMAAGTLLCYALGTSWFMLTSGTGLWGALGACVLPFLPGDALKIALAVSLCIKLQKPLHTLGLCP